MKAPNITKGPWVFFGGWDVNQYRVFNDETGRWLMTIQHNGEQLEAQQNANIKAMTAAPELLEALIDFRRWHKDVYGYLNGPEVDSAMRVFDQKFKAALLKAGCTE